MNSPGLNSAASKAIAQFGAGVYYLAAVLITPAMNGAVEDIDGSKPANSALDSGVPEQSDDSLITHTLQSEFQPGESELRVLLPDSLEPAVSFLVGKE